MATRKNETCIVAEEEEKPKIRRWMVEADRGEGDAGAKPGSRAETKSKNQGRRARPKEDAARMPRTS